MFTKVTAARKDLCTLPKGSPDLRGNFRFAQPPEDRQLQGLPLRLRQLIDHFVKKNQTIINQGDFLRVGQPSRGNGCRRDSSRYIGEAGL